MPRKNKIPAWAAHKDHPDGFPICCCFGPKPTLILDGTVARRFIKLIEEEKQRLETALRIEEQEQQEGGEA